MSLHCQHRDLLIGDHQAKEGIVNVINRLARSVRHRGMKNASESWSSAPRGGLGEPPAGKRKRMGPSLSRFA